MTASSFDPALFQPTSGVYVFYDDEDQILYVGLTTNLPERMKAHRREPWWKLARRAEFTPTSSRSDALELESAEITRLRPRFNTRYPGASGEAERRGTVSDAKSALMTAEDDQKMCVLHIRMSEAELKALRARADADHRTVSDYARLILTADPEPLARIVPTVARKPKP